MPIDQVHDMQKVYRKIVDSMSRPGKLANLETNAERIEYDVACYHATLLIAMTLLDGEVSFHVISQNNQSVEEKIAAYTLAKHASMEEADYIIVLQDATDASIIEGIAACKKGDLIDPQYSSTWIMESATPLSNQSQLQLAGPGIETKTNLHTNFTADVWQARTEAVLEYPLGIDVIVTDERHQVACVPRTTQISVREVK
ncbi:phosphonate C-P lyase system protein PhnH [Virgibacillus halodenitrificans]|uniref:Phosphonate C-P lyase system protein PhnH n=1 Tax=Virgibacillus halodenitrificans TaxID=1482 RepID=A0AAC9J1V2_VIRHA|nr:phosphonate C-P lyase system protein PhnH [Virgibacillus halodenitrificans]APC50016.1 phosphonate C-P lyase system protein PhnH [Virgibacillus halodenitrificans]MCJ0932175.1 phosphonate C-P lyase system protein PhnH [Virgibacillus halodenitrificans]